MTYFIAVNKAIVGSEMVFNYSYPRKHGFIVFNDEIREWLACRGLHKVSMSWNDFTTIGVVSFPSTARREALFFKILWGLDK